MTEKGAIAARHSVRQYEEKPVAADTVAEMKAFIDEINQESGLHIQLVTDEPRAFSGFRAHYGKFSGVTDYIALIGPKSTKLEEQCGYYGEKIVLKAQMLGLNTCWVALTYRKVPEAYKVQKNEALKLVISLGYGKTQGHARKSKSFADVARTDGYCPEWFTKGVDAALLAPTAINQQAFTFELKNGRVIADAGKGPCARVDLGIAKYHFEVGSGKTSDIWG